MDIIEHSLDSSSIPDQVILKSEVVETKAVDELIIEEDGSLSDDGRGEDGLAHAQAILDADESVQYHWKATDGTTYRVLHMSHDDLDESDLRGTIIQQSGGGGGTSHHQPVVLASNVSSNHHYFVVNEGNLAGVLQRPLVPRANVVLETRTSQNPHAPTSRVQRDDRRRATHNEVERRRRDKINNWIAKLSKIIPDCRTMDNKTSQSKGGILATACDYITELKEENAQLQSCAKDKERLTSHVSFLQQQNEKLKMENTLLRSQLRSRFPNTESTDDVQHDSNAPNNS